MKKLLSIFCVLVLIAALLCGCAVTPAPSESTADATTAPTTTVTTAATTEAPTVAPTTTETTTTVATTAPTTAPVTRPTFDPSIPVLEWDAEIRGVEAIFDYGDYTYRVQLRSDRVSVVAYNGDEEEVIVPGTTVPYIFNDKLYTAKVEGIRITLYYDNPHVKTVRWVEGSWPYLTKMNSSPIENGRPEHIYLPKDVGFDKERLFKSSVDMVYFWPHLLGSATDGSVHVYLIKGAPLTEMLYDERMATPYNCDWELDFSEEGTYCFYRPIEGKDDQQAVYFHVAESFE